MLLILIKVLNRCLPRKDSPLSTTEDSFSQTNKCNEYYTSVGISAVLKAKLLLKNMDLNNLLENSSLQDDKCPLFEFQPDYGKRNREDHKILTVKQISPPGLSHSQGIERQLTITLAATTNIVKTSLSSNAFAQVWKLAEVISMFKSSDPDEPSNTRTIPLLPMMSKAYERAAHSQFVNFLDQNEKNSKLQSGNRRLLPKLPMKFLRTWTNNMSKLFDNIRHDLMVSKLQSIGVSSVRLVWNLSFSTKPCCGRTARFGSRTSSVYTVCK